MQTVLSYWWLVFPLGGVVGGWFGALGKYNERRRRDKIEMLRIQHGLAQQTAGSLPPPPGLSFPAPEGQPVTGPPTPGPVQRGDVERVLADHAEVDQRWLAYEMDLHTVIDYPMMTDLREPPTVDFHRARVTAEELRPADAGAMTDPARLAEYRRAVRDYRVAFDVAEREARRRRHAGFSDSERASLERAQKLVSVALDEAASPAERQLAYRQASRELEGLIAVPEPAQRDIQRRIAGALEPGPAQ